MGDELEEIERIGRVCYKSEDKIMQGSAEKFVRMLIKRGHESVLEHNHLSVRFVCDRGVSHELVRHRLASFSQESTRYCDYSDDEKHESGITFIRPCFIEKDSDEYHAWVLAMKNAEASYYYMCKTLNLKPEAARCVLPNSLKTEVVMSANYREWRHFFKLRTALAAHPQMRELTVPLLRDLQTRIPVVFDDISI